MLTKNEIKFIRALNQKKNRNKDLLFVAEGEKLVSHFLKLGLPHVYLFSTATRDGAYAYREISEKEMQQISNLSTPSSTFGVFKQPEFGTVKKEDNFVFVLDGIRDPGNLGTILRLCDWFGISAVYGTPNCVDAFNPKVVQSSMGSVASVQLFIYSPEELIEKLREKGFQLIGTKMEAPNVFETSYSGKTALILGNEGQGISAAFMQAADGFVAIPKAPSAHAESLNVAMAASIFISDYYRKKSG